MTKNNIYLVCRPYSTYDCFGKLLEDNGYDVIEAFQWQEDAQERINVLNKDLEIDEGDMLYFIRSYRIK